MAYTARHLAFKCFLFVVDASAALYYIIIRRTRLRLLKLNKIVSLNERRSFSVKRLHSFRTMNIFIFCSLVSLYPACTVNASLSRIVAGGVCTYGSIEQFLNFTSFVKALKKSACAEYSSAILSGFSVCHSRHLDIIKSYSKLNVLSLHTKDACLPGHTIIHNPCVVGCVPPEPLLGRLSNRLLAAGVHIPCVAM